MTEGPVLWDLDRPQLFEERPTQPIY